jgi:hypothetical protein
MILIFFNPFANPVFGTSLSSTRDNFGTGWVELAGTNTFYYETCKIEFHKAYRSK